MHPDEHGDLKDAECANPISVTQLDFETAEVHESHENIDKVKHNDSIEYKPKGPTIIDIILKDKVCSHHEACGKEGNNEIEPHPE